ncbi:MAG: efflux RND transporter permease subunit [Planctomycetaceae bacterium]|nr:efflux RND transporter permease subunit [Planctomycetaceae bacterium]
MFTKFLHRPALAIVISLFILFMGGLSINLLPISQFPTVAPPSVRVSVSYPGASAKILIDSTMVILEQAINGVPNMRYMMGDATSAGEGTITIVFEPGTDPRVATMQVTNRVQAVKNNLPPIVQREGIIVRQYMTSMLMYVNVFSRDPNFNQNDLYNYTSVNVQREIKRIPGVGQAQILGNRAYAMRVELDLDRMRAYRVSSEDVMKALDDQSMIGSPGRLGQATGLTSQTREYVLTWTGRYKTPEQYQDIILRASPDGEILRLRDVANVRLGSAFYDLYSDLDGYPSAAIVLKQVPGSNAADVIEQIKEKLEEIKQDRFPPGMDYAITYDVSAFLDASIEKVLHTLFEAFVLVSLVVFLFLGDFRSTLIPTLAVPVSLIGTFFFMQTFGLSINLITLFALVLAIGIVVDDAIVVVEAVHEKMHTKHLGPYKATKEVVHEISGAIVAITLVMTAVFIPVTFVPGPVGVFYRQFGITMAVSIILSGIVALTLTPVLCAMVLKPLSSHEEPRGLAGLVNRILSKVAGRYAPVLRGLLAMVLGAATGAGAWYVLHLEFVPELISEQIPLTETRIWILVSITAVLAALTVRAGLSGADGTEKKRGPLGVFLHLFDRGVEKVTGAYAAIVGRIISRRVLMLLLIGGFCYGIIAVNGVLPAGFIPAEDQGMIYGVIQTPPGSTLEYTNAKCHELQAVCKEMDEISSVASVAGYEVLTEGRGSNAGTCLINLKPWADRELTSREIIEELEERGRKIADVRLEFFEPPAVPGFGMAGGFSVNLLDKTNSDDYKLLGEETGRFMEALGKRKELKGLFTFFAANYPQYEIVIDNQAAMQKGVSIRDAMDNLSIVVGSTWEQGFVRFGQFYKVYVQAAPEFRRHPEDLENMFVRNDRGEMVPYTSFMSIRKTQGLNEISRYNLYPTAPIQGAPARGYSSGEAIAAIQEVAAETLPRGFDIDWRGLAYDEAQKGNEAVYIFLIVVVFVYLVLVGQYESFIIPLAVIISLPVGIFGSFLLLRAMGLANDVYCQIGLVMLVGLLGKNAILIVEFAVQRRQEGLSIMDAGIEGARLRFRPILMTSFAFIVGLVPLVRASGAGSIGNRTIGSTGVGGMLMGTLVGVFIIPGLYYVVAKMADGKALIRDEHDEPLSEILEREQAPAAH